MSIHYSQNLHAIAAILPNRGIGHGNQLMVHDSMDMFMFFNVTIGHTVVMGRKTFESMQCRPLSYRKNIVLSETLPENTPGVQVARSVMNLMHMIDQSGTYVIGGGQIYQLLLPYCRYVHLTKFEQINTTQLVLPADTYFPELSNKEWKVVNGLTVERKIDYDVTNKVRFETYVRIQ